MQEIWKDVYNYEGYYQVSNLGRVRSLDRIIPRGYKQTNLKGKILNLNKNNSGYLYVNLCVNNIRNKVLVHRLVAQMFIPNPLKLNCVNHKDENKLNNSVVNLEWCDYKYNNNYGTFKQRVSIGNSKPIRCVELNLIFESQTKASKHFNIKSSAISFCCYNHKNTAGGYHWEFAEG